MGLYTASDNAWTVSVEPGRITLSAWGQTTTLKEIEPLAQAEGLATHYLRGSGLTLPRLVKRDRTRTVSETRRNLVRFLYHSSVSVRAIATLLERDRRDIKKLLHGRDLEYPQ